MGNVKEVPRGTHLRGKAAKPIPDAIAAYVIRPTTIAPTMRGVAEVDEDHRGELRWLPTSALFVPEEYQRTLIEDHSRQIAREFDWLVFGTLVASDRGDGTYAIVDGQNRCRGAVLRGIPEVPCMVHRFQSIAQEARTYDLLNSRRRPVSVWCRQKSELYQGDPVAEAAKLFMDTIGSEAVPLGTVRQMSTRFCVELVRLTPLLRELLLVSKTPLRADFLEAICVLEATLGENASLTNKWRQRTLANGYDDLLAGMATYEARVGILGSGMRGWKAKANALLYALNTRVNSSFDPRSPNRNPHRQPYGTMVKGEYWEDAADELEAAE